MKYLAFLFFCFFSSLARSECGDFYKTLDKFESSIKDIDSFATYYMGKAVSKGTSSVFQVIDNLYVLKYKAEGMKAGVFLLGYDFDKNVFYLQNIRFSFKEKLSGKAIPNQCAIDLRSSRKDSKVKTLIILNGGIDVQIFDSDSANKAVAEYKFYKEK